MKALTIFRDIAFWISVSGCALVGAWRHRHSTIDAMVYMGVALLALYALKEDAEDW